MNDMSSDRSVSLRLLTGEDDVPDGLFNITSTEGIIYLNKSELLVGLVDHTVELIIKETFANGSNLSACLNITISNGSVSENVGRWTNLHFNHKFCSNNDVSMLFRPLLR